MKKWTKRLTSVYLLLAALSSIGQDLPLGTWRTHFSYQNARLLASGDEKIFCAAENGIFFIELSDKSINKLSKLNGLSDAGATSLAYDETTETLLIGYASGLLDLVTDDGVTTLREINETNLPGIKTIRDIAVHQEKAYLATTFGIVVVAIDTKEIIETYRSIGPNGTDGAILDIEVINDQIFATMENGIQSGFLHANLLDFNNWFRYGETAAGEYKDFAAVGSQIYTIFSNDEIAVLQDDTWQSLNIDFEDELVDLHSHENELYVLTKMALYLLKEGALTLFRQEELFKDANAFLYKNGFWIADGENGLISPEGKAIKPDGPLSDQITSLSFTNSQVFALYGPDSEYHTEHVDSMGYSFFDNHNWYNETIEDFYNITDVANYRGNLYFSSAGFGLYNQTSGEILDQTNSPLQSGWSSLGPVITKLGKGEKMYLLSYDSISSLYVMTEDDELLAYPSEYVGTENPVFISISENEVLWITRSDSYGGGIFLLDVESGDYRLLNTSSQIPSNTVNSMVIDRNDDAWIATARGPALYPDASFPFDGFNAIQPVFENQLLFEDENVSSIAVDGGNRIWISTSAGIFVFNNALTELLDQFTLANSPLPSTNINQFAYNPANGEMFILTDKGLISLRTGSSAGADKQGSVSVFPNPVRPGYSGLVGINGMVTDASIKITDVNGKLIRQLDANGGTASWDLMDYNRKRVNSGIYIILSSSADGEVTYVGKIAVIN